MPLTKATAVPVAYPSGASRRAPRPADLLVLAATLLLVLAGLAGLVPPLAVVALASAIGSVLAGVRLSRLAAPGRETGPTGDGLARLARPDVPDRLHRRAARCRPAAGLLDAAVAMVGLTVAVLPLVGSGLRAAVGAAGLGLAALAHTGGLLLLPGRSRLPARARVRRAVDVVSLGLSLVFAAWVLLPPGPVPPAARVAAVAGGFGVAAIGVAALADWRRRPGAAICLLGTGAAHFGLLALIVLLVYDAPGPALLTTVGPLVVGALLTAAGVRRVAAGDPCRPGGPPPAWPRVSAPAVIAALAAGGHLAVYGDFAPGTVLLGLAVVPLLVVRELISVTDNRRYAARLAAQEAHFRALVAGDNDLILLLDEASRVRWQSPAATRLFALTDAQVVGRPFVALLHPDDVLRAALLLDGARAGVRPTLLLARLRDGHGAWRETESTISDQRDVPELHALVLHVRDVGERRRLERAVRQLAVTDQLTGLVNRGELLGELAARRHGTGALLVVGLHGLGAVNDGRGHVVGDVAVVEVARRLRATVGPDDLVARLIGNEFGIVTTTGPVLAYALGARLLEALAEPYRVAGGEVRLQASIGLAEVSGAAADDVLRQADLARRRAAQLGRDRIEWYDGYLEEQLVRRLDLERELPGAVARGELDLVYQPVLGLTDLLPVGTEALLRWRSPVLGTVLPTELLPVAEDLDLLGEVGRWVLDRACRQLADWSVGDRRLWMSVNVTPRELAAPDFLQRAAAVLATHGVPPDRLVVEVAEPRIGAELTTVVARLGGLRSLGVRTALDDFRAAHASLAQLRRLPIDLLKLAPHGVDAADAGQRPPAGSGQRPLTDVVVSLGTRLGLEIVAAQLETPAQVDAAGRAGCRYGQGFALARPATAERVEAYFEEFPSASR
ncbi:putative bifunctional diguanylate cyclase/phosphodiesterase [Micromonospora sp. RTGN7]|uniref:putative bifunctional diguanylate cyclase/phosphodiesterase n=1 Tax=Micromonospora sp. RTGN7 TaxID=3016526 RepID=UPI0029FF3B94|nr:EAL domain-containing protein [Micromonospora sp. RTGN7]